MVWGMVGRVGVGVAVGVAWRVLVDWGELAGARLCSGRGRGQALARGACLGRGLGCCRHRVHSGGVAWYGRLFTAVA